MNKCISSKGVFVATLAAMLLLATSCIYPDKHQPGELLLAPLPSYGAAPLIRVKLSKATGAETISVNASKGYLTLDGQRREFSGVLSLTRSSGLVQVAEQGAATMVEIEPTGDPAWFELDGRIYRGHLRLLAGPGGWEVVNVVDLEQYIAGVIGWEMIASWPLEALKAQAIASRTYALFEMERAREAKRQWDLDDTTQYQVYGGVGPVDKPNQWRETANVLAAREQTNGMVMTWQGKGFRAFFHSTSGGHTVDPRTGLGVDDSIPPLAGVDLGEYAKESPKFQWTQKLEDRELTARLIENGISPHELLRVEAHETAISGHAITLKLYDRTGHSSIVAATVFRHALGLFSTNFTATKTGSEWTFTGKGYGHGCGMCQWSARGMAKAGHDSNNIIETMYPGTVLKRLY